MLRIYGVDDGCSQFYLTYTQERARVEEDLQMSIFIRAAQKLVRRRRRSLIIIGEHLWRKSRRPTARNASGAIPSRGVNASTP